ncbi:MAG: PP2C family protein-serine/threonine phosphatase [Pyrinomonadaceae bacterium]
MRKLRRIAGRRLTGLWGAVRRRASPARVLLLAEIAVVVAVLSFLLTGERAALLDGIGNRADITATIFVLTLFGLLHALARRRALNIIEVRFFGHQYDERQILSDLGHAARGVNALEELFQLVTDRIHDALDTENVSIFVRDDASGDYVCAICSPPCEAEQSGELSHRATPQSLKPESLRLARDSFIVRRLRRLAVPLKLDAKDFEVWMRALDGGAPAEKIARQRESAVLQRIGSRLLLQIMMKDQLVGVISLGARANKREFTAEDNRMLISVAGQMAFIIENAKLVGRMAEEERLKREVALAIEVQQRLFPEHPPASDSLELTGFCQPAREVGGDYYDFLALADGQIGIAVADVAGKGISAALLMSIVQASLRSQATAHNQLIGVEKPLADLVSTMNRLMYSSTGASSYATFFYAQFEETTRRLSYVNAGHNPPLLVRTKTDQRAHSKPIIRQEVNIGAFALSARRSSSGDGDGATVLATPHTKPSSQIVVKLTNGGPAIGVLNDCVYDQETIQLQTDDLIVAYTDGVTESLNAEDEEFGEDRLQEILIEAAHLPASEVSEEIKRRVREWSAGTPQHDDLTFVVMKVK